MAIELTEKQEAFAHAYVECGSASEAYKRAYETSSEWTPNALYVESCRALQHPKIALRIEQLKAKHRKRHEITIDKLTDWLEQALEKAMAEPKGASAAVSAVLGIGKLHGLVVDKKEVTQKRDATDLSVEELYAIAGVGRSRDHPQIAGPREPDSVH